MLRAIFRCLLSIIHNYNGKYYSVSSSIRYFFNEGNILSNLFLQLKGIVIFFKDLHSKKAFSPILDKLAGSEILFKEEHMKKAKLPMFFTPYEIIISRKELQFPNAESPMLTTLDGTVNFCLSDKKEIRKDISEL